MQTAFRFPLCFDRDVIHLLFLDIVLMAGKDHTLGWTAHILKKVAIFYAEGGGALAQVAERWSMPHPGKHSRSGRTGL